MPIGRKLGVRKSETGSTVTVSVRITPEQLNYLRGVAESFGIDIRAWRQGAENK